VARVIEIKRRSEPATRGADDERPSVLVEKGRIDVAADSASSVVFAPGSPYFQRGESLVRLIQGADAAKHRKSSEAPLLLPASGPMLLDDLERACRFYSRSSAPDSDEVRIRTVACPKALPAVLLARAGRLPIPSIRGIAELPLLHSDGSLVKSGYDNRAGVIVVAPGDWPEPPECPSEADARAALALINQVIEGFPFVAESDRSVTLAAMLSAILRPVLPSCPAFAWSAPVRGSGKSKLADVVAVLATGRTAPALTWPPQEDEAEKRLGASVMAGDAVILLDNIETALRGACLNSLLTQPTVAVRMLGRSQLIRLGAAVLVLATGNNLVLLGDLSRRFLVSHLDPHTERPELRRFDFDPVARAMAKRRELVGALQTIAKWGVSAQTGLPPLGSFEEWSRRVRDPLVALGLPDCCEVLDSLHRSDPERESAIEVLAEWRRAFGAEATTVASAIRSALHDPALRDALDGVAGGPGGISPKRLGKYLARQRDRIFGALVLRRQDDLVSNTAAWSVQSTGDASGFRVTGSDSNGAEKKTEKTVGPTVNPDTRKAGNEADAYRKASRGDSDVPF